MKTYHHIWTKFNNFVIKLDYKPPTWEERIALYCGYLIEKGVQSSTLKSYISAIKCILKNDNYEWDENKILFSSITRACKLVNDQVKVRLPIQINLLEMIIFEIERYFNGKNNTQLYLETLYKCLFITAYYGLLRIGEITTGSHPVKAKDVHIAKKKIKFFLCYIQAKRMGKNPDLRK